MVESHENPSQSSLTELASFFLISYIFKDQCGGMVGKGNSCNKLEKRKVMGYKAMHQIAYGSH